MGSWTRRIRGAVGIGLTWAAGWAAVGVLIGVTSRLLPGLPWGRLFEVFDAPLPTLAIPGFIGGLFFSTVLGIAGRRRRFDELSVPRFATWGAAGGLLLSLVPVAMAAAGVLETPLSTRDLWLLTATVAPPLMVLGAASATGSLLVARRSERAALGAGRAHLATDNRSET